MVIFLFSERKSLSMLNFQVPLAKDSVSAPNYKEDANFKSDFKKEEEIKGVGYVNPKEMQSRTSSGAISIKKLGSCEFKGISCYVCNAQKHKTEKNPRYTSRCRKSDSAYSEICFQKKKKCC